MSLQNTPILSDAVPRVGTLGWYALPRWGKSNDGVSIACPRPKKDIRVAPNACGTPTLSTTNPDKSGCPRFTPEKPDWRARHIPQDGYPTFFPSSGEPARAIGGWAFDGGFRGWYEPSVMAPREPSG